MLIIHFILWNPRKPISCCLMDWKEKIMFLHRNVILWWSALIACWCTREWFSSRKSNICNFVFSIRLTHKNIISIMIYFCFSCRNNFEKNLIYLFMRTAWYSGTASDKNNDQQFNENIISTGWNSLVSLYFSLHEIVVLIIPVALWKSSGMRSFCKSAWQATSFDFFQLSILDMLFQKIISKCV